MESTSNDVVGASVQGRPNSAIDPRTIRVPGASKGGEGGGQQPAADALAKQPLGIDPSSIRVPGLAKGGEEGDALLPPSVTNAAFIGAIFGQLPEGATAAICSKAGSPDEGGWLAEPAGDVDVQCPAENNNYFNCSSFMSQTDGSVQARKESFCGYHAVVLDDVGTKIEGARLEGVEATWRIETSPSNFQVGFALSEPLTDAAVIKAVQDGVKNAGLSDPGAAGLARWMRLPNAINGKAKYRDADGNAYRCKLVEWEPSKRFSVPDLVEVLGLTLSPARPARSSSQRQSSAQPTPLSNEVFSQRPEENPVITALKANGLYKRSLGDGRHEITCPWVHEHTDELDTGAVYFEPDDNYPLGGFCCQHSHRDDYHVGELLRHLAVPPDDARHKHQIRAVSGDFDTVVKAAERVLALNGGYYQAGGLIVSTNTDKQTGDASISALSEHEVMRALSREALWLRKEGKADAWVRIDPPTRHVKALHASQSYDYLPVLNGIGRQPFFRETDDVLISTPGYDSASGIFAAFDSDDFALPGTTKAAACDALELLKDLVAEFHFATEFDRSATICAMLTAATRATLPVAPAFNITASGYGSGKSYLAETVAPFAGGGQPVITSYPTSAEEAGKVMLAHFLTAPASITFDDMQTDWQPYGQMNQCLTSSTITGRILGLSQTATANTRSLIMGTGNNIEPIGDMSRRVVSIRLAPKTSTPATLSYTGTPAKDVRVDRGRYVSAALTIIAAYQAAGSPDMGSKSIATYDLWSKRCREPLIWLGLPDPAASLIEQVRNDPASEALQALVTAWHEAFGERTIFVRTLLAKAHENPDSELGEALADLPFADRGALSPTKLGYYLKRNMGRIVQGLAIQKAESGQRNAWRIERVNLSDGSST